MWRAVLILVCAGCSGSGNAEPETPFVLRVGTSTGLMPMTSTTDTSFTSNLLDLVYVPLDRHFASLRAEGPTLHLTRSPSSDRSPSELARAFEHPEAVRVSEEPEGIAVHFATEGVAKAITLDQALLSLGPYSPREYTGDRMVLRRRLPGIGPEVIEVLAFPTQEEEWRRFLARDVDILSYAPLATSRHLRDVPSVRVVMAPTNSTEALYFNLARAELKDGRMRRAISLALRRSALAEVAAGDSNLAVRAHEDRVEARLILKALGYDADHPLHLRLIGYGALPQAERIALVAQQQLAPLGVILDVTLFTDVEFFARTMVVDRDYDLAIFSVRYAPEYLSLYFVSSASFNWSGYANPEYDVAVRRGDFPRAIEILERDPPFVTLFKSQDGIAMDRALCGAQFETVGDVRWLANVHPCAPGETQ